MSELFRPGRDLLMGPITGIRPDDDRWGGEMAEEWIEAIVADVQDDIAKLDVGSFTPDALLTMVVIQTAVRTGQRLAVELDGCAIDTTTIFEDDANE